MQPCEVIVLNILPSLRAQLARELVKLGLTQQEISETLELTPAAVSQYVSGKRGQKVEFNSEVKQKIHQKAKKIKNNKENNPFDIICKVCDEIKTTDVFCELLEKYEERECSECKYEPICSC